METKDLDTKGISSQASRTYEKQGRQATRKFLKGIWKQIGKEKGLEGLPQQTREALSKIFKFYSVGPFKVNPIPNDPSRIVEQLTSMKTVVAHDGTVRHEFGPTMVVRANGRVEELVRKPKP
jgi:hypothetical protein